MKRFVAVFFLLSGLLVAGWANATPTTYIDTNPGTSSIGSFGNPGSTAYGQVITFNASAGVITQFTFESVSCGTPGNYKAYIYAWDGSNATGSALFTSSEQSLASGATTASVSVPNLSLTSGQYVLFFSVDGVSSAPAGCTFSTVAGSTYTGGTFVFNNTSSPFTVGAGWNTFASTDLAFSVITDPAPPSAVPTLSEWSQLLLALMTIMLVGWHFHRERSY